MKKETKAIVSEVFIYFLLVVYCLLLAYSIIYFVWNRYYDHLLNSAGQEATATIISKDIPFAYYDFEYDGVYYKGKISLTKSAYRRIRIGERFPVLVLPDKLKNYREFGITPRCFKLLLIQQPDYLQDFETEINRIHKMYEGDFYIPPLK